MMQRRTSTSHGAEHKKITMARIPLPPGNGTLGLTFSGSPPVVTNVVPESPLRSKLSIGDVIYGVSVPHLLEAHGVEDSSILSHLLAKTANLRRFLLLTTIHDEQNDPSETEYHISLPPGRLGLTFDGDSQPTIAKVWDYCPVREFVQEGQWLKSIMIPTESEPIPCQHVSARDVYEVLRASCKRKGRVLVLTNPPLAVAEPVLASSMMMNDSFHTSRSHYSTITADTASSSHGCSTRIDATIEHSVLTMSLRPRQRVRCDHECMIYMSEGFRVKTHGMNVRDFSKGFPLGLTEFIYEGPRKGTVAFGTGGQVVNINLDDHYGRVICQAGAYLCSEMSIKVYVESVSQNGESMQIRLSGTGQVWLSANGSIITKTLARGETLRCASGALVACEKTVQSSSHRMRGGLKSFVNPGGRKDCSWTELTGPGAAWLQTSVCPGNHSFPMNTSKSYQQAPSQGASRSGSNRAEL